MESNSTASSKLPNSVPSTTTEILHDLRPMLIIYKDGRVERLLGKETVPPNPNDDVVPSKDVEISPNVYVRLYLPKKTTRRLPLLIYFHGGGFAIESASSPTYHNYLPRLAAESSAVVVSVNYRLAPEHPLPAAYDDCWSAVEWALTTTTTGGGSPPDPWICDHADLSRVYFAGDSAGGNIAHHMGLRFGKEKGTGSGVRLAGVVLVHPFFLGEGPIYGDDSAAAAAGREFGKRFWGVVCDEPGKSVDHPWINPEKDGDIGRMGCDRVLVFVAEKDSLRNRGVYYAEEVLEKCGEWGGKVEVVESLGEGHVFHLFNAGCDNAVKLMHKFATFING